MSGPIRVWKGRHETIVEYEHVTMEYSLQKPRKKALCGVWVDGERIGDAEE